MHEPATLSRRALAVVLPLTSIFGTPSPSTAAAQAEPDPTLAQIEQHRELRLAIGRTSCRDADPAYVKACDVEEAALQALGDVVPVSIAGAAALLAYMAETEADFADDQSPLLRTVLSVARGLEQMGRIEA